MKLLHGTNALFTDLLPPSATTNQRETRKGNLGVVFATSNLNMAKGYAGQAVKQLGWGSPLVLEVEGDFRPWKNKPGCTIFVAPCARVVGVLPASQV